jgi:dipeptidyl aminopeptidase/acylaminoacyl peptidase
VSTPFTVEDVQRLRFVRSAGFVPGGGVWYTVSEIDDELTERDNLWLAARDGSGARRLRESVGAPAVSPDGGTIAVLADGQVVLVPVDGGEERVLTSLPQGASGPPAWSPDGASLAFTAGPAQKRDPSLPYRVTDRRTYRFDGLGHLDDVVTDVYVVEVATGSVRQLPHDRNMNSAPQWSPDGGSVSYLVSYFPDRVYSFLPELHVVELASGTTRVVVGDWGGVFGRTWLADGRIAFIGMPTPPADTHFGTRTPNLFTVSDRGGEPECRSAGVLTGVGLTMSSHQTDLPVAGDLGADRLRADGDAVYAGGQVGGDIVLYRVALEGPESVEQVLGEPGRSVYLYDHDPASGFLHQATTFVDPPDLYVGQTRLTSLNDELLSARERPAVHPLSVTAPDGVPVEAWALVPPGAGPWPAVLYVHGGPYAAAFGSTFDIDFQLLAGAGFAVLAHNFRGSSGYGAEFSAKIFGRWGKQGELDHHATLDAAVAAGIADPERLGVCGLSHGGFATCWLLSTSHRFRAGVAENAAATFTAQYGVMDSESWLVPEFGGPPSEHPDAYRDASPLTYASSCRTPLLFVIGEQDLRCHPIESEQFYRVLKTNGVPSEMVRLPGSSHGGSAYGPVPARIAQNEALVDWFVRYLR